MVLEFDNQRLGPFLQLNQKIHNSILEGSGNRLLNQQYQSLAARTRLMRYRTNFTPEKWRKAIEEHHQIVEALTARRASDLADILRHHLDGKWESIVETLQA